MKTGIELITDERFRQVAKEGWTPEHDDTHKNGELIEAAGIYAMVASAEVRGSTASEWPFGMVISGELIMQWPWDEKWYKPSDDPIRNLVRAGALIAAEIDRLQRLQAANG